MSNSHTQVDVDAGDTVHDDEGRVLGIVDEFTDDGFDVAVIAVDSHPGSTTGDADRDSADTADVPGKDFGEGHLMWRCEDCGEMGALDAGFPETCPDCGAPKEHIHVAQED